MRLVLSRLVVVRTTRVVLVSCDQCFTPVVVSLLIDGRTLDSYVSINLIYL